MNRHTFMSDGYYAVSGKEFFEDQNENYRGEAIDRLAYYENLEEEGRLFVVNVDYNHPCKTCDSGWASISSDGYKSCYETCERLKQYNKKY